MIKVLTMQDGKPAADSSPKKIESIPVHLIKPNPYQPRKNFSLQGLEELSQSIKQYGVIQPITVRRAAQEGYELIAGERRLRAARLAGLETIPAVVINVYEQESAIIAMIENLQRENLHYLEEGMGYASLIKDHGLTQEELAATLGKNQSTIANKLRILRLSTEIKNILIREKLTERHARALLKLPDNESRMKVIGQVVENKLNVKDTEEIVEKLIQEIQDEQEKHREKGSKLKIKHKQKKKFKRTRDMRIFVNTIHRAVDLLKSYGLEVQYMQSDKEEKIEITIIIPKV